MLTVDGWLQEFAPAAGIEGMLRCSWRGDLGAMRTPLPDECVDVIWVEDGSMWMSGPESRSWPRDYSPGSNAVGVRFQPGVGPAVLGVPAHQMRDARWPLDAVVPSRDMRSLAQRLADHDNDHDRLQTLQQAVVSLAAGARPVDRTTTLITELVTGHQLRSGKALVAATGLSQRQLHRRCADAFGYGPATLTRIARVQRLLGMARCSSGWCLADLAVRAGFCDQQHLSHEVRSIFGVTPTVLLAHSDV